MADTVAAPAVKTSSKSAVVSMGCKLPHGLRLQVFDMVDVDVPVMGGGMKTVKEARQNTEAGEYVLEGCAVAFGVQKALHGGYALTHNIPRDFAERWMSERGGSDMVRNKMIVIVDRADDDGLPRELAGVRSGLEPLAQKDDPRAPKHIKPDAEKDAA